MATRALALVWVQVQESWRGGCQGEPCLVGERDQFSISQRSMAAVIVADT
jgi:hypothetical protein